MKLSRIERFWARIQSAERATSATRNSSIPPLQSWSVMSGLLPIRSSEFPISAELPS